MTQNTTYLIDQLDASLSGAISPDFDSTLRTNPEMAEEWNSLQIALSAIREAGLQDQVADVAKEYRSVKIVSMKKPAATVRPMFGNLLKIAAAIFVLFMAGGIYKYSSVSSSNFYNKNFSVYELSVSRGNSGTDQLEKAYQEKKWTSVIEKFNALDKKSNKSIFLAAMANMELKNATKAIPLFNEILKNNAAGTDELFHDEAEYYLALGYLANQEAGKAIPILEKIKSDKNHLYNRVVNDMSWLDLKIIQYKNGK
jgi:tetratricopeptide (TPR) repeat protein